MTAQGRFFDALWKLTEKRLSDSLCPAGQSVLWLQWTGCSGLLSCTGSAAESAAGAELAALRRACHARIAARTLRRKRLQSDEAGHVLLLCPVCVSVKLMENSSSRRLTMIYTPHCVCRQLHSGPQAASQAPRRDVPGDLNASMIVLGGSVFGSCLVHACQACHTTVTKPA